MAKSGATADPLLNKAEQLTEETQNLIAEIQKQRETGTQPYNVIKSFASQVKGQTGPFNTFGQFLKAVKDCPNGSGYDRHPLMKQWLNQADAMHKALPSGMNETVGADGGVLVPPQFAANILMRMYAPQSLLGMTTLVPITVGNTMKLPAVNETSRANGSRYGGVASYWRSEAGTITLSKPGLHEVTLTLDSLTVAIRLTNELMEDAGPALEAFINKVAPDEIDFRVGDAIVNGDGVTKPLGLLSSLSKVTVSKEAGQAAATIVPKNVEKMWARLHPSCRANAVWLSDQTTEPELNTMTLGTGGSQSIVYMPAGGLSAKPYDTLKGRPVLSVEFCQQLGTEGDLILTDLSTVLSATKGGVAAASSIHLYFLTNEQAFRWVIRIDARPWWTSALTPKNGGPTQSNVVVLETRS